jgi:peptidoglycan/xylan/chitin deacetylase (PgdA/CDA1 family)
LSVIGNPSSAANPIVMPHPLEQTCAERAARYLRRPAALRRIGRKSAPALGRYLFLNSALRALQRDQPRVLCYHSVVADPKAVDLWNCGNVAPVSEFAEQMELLARTMHPITPGMLQGWFYAGTPLPPDAVLVTFDDGYRNNLSLAAPVLRRFGIPALFFVSTDYVGDTRCLWPTEVYRSIALWPSSDIPLPDRSTIHADPRDTAARAAIAEWVREFCKALPDDSRSAYLSILRSATLPPLSPAETEISAFLNWDEVRELSRMGFTIGSHTVTHPILTRLPSSELDFELQASRRRIEAEVGALCTALAYPNGTSADYSSEVLGAVCHAGYQLAFTTHPAPCAPSDSPLTINRICIPGQLSCLGFETKLSCLHDHLRKVALRS